MTKKTTKFLHLQQKLVNQDSKKDKSMVEKTYPETRNESISPPEEKDHVVRAWSLHTLHP